MDEMILAVSRKNLFGEKDEGVFQGFKKGNFEFLYDAQSYVVKRRGDLEEDPTFKQLITYVVIKSEQDNEYLVYQRIGNSETRLHMKSSIGVGGHVNEIKGEYDLADILYVNAIRELTEELHIDDGINRVSLIGYINDDSDDVGQVHLGVVYETTVSSKEVVEVAETDNLKMAWKSKEELEKDKTLENWSKILVPYL